MHQNNSEVIKARKNQFSLANIGTTVKALKTTTYFCGQFSLSCKSDNIIDQLKKWLKEECLLNKSSGSNSENSTKSEGYESNSTSKVIFSQQEYSAQQRKELNGLFYQRFVDCMLPGKRKKNCKNEESFSENNCIGREVDFFSIQLNKTIRMTYKGQELSFELTKLDLYFLPHGFLIYSFCAEQHDLLYDAITYINSRFRAPGRYVSAFQINIEQDVLDIFQPLLFIFNLNYPSHSAQQIKLDDYSSKNVQRYSDLIENGNKLKLFTITEENSECPYPEYYCRENLLFDLATCSPIGASVDPENPFHPSNEYYQQLVNDNRISLFNNWQALSLFDSFVVILNNAKWYQVDCWKKDYYRFIYLHSVYVKNYLSYVNREFRKKNTSRHLMDEFLEFDKNYNFHKISYNFLPQAIYEKVRQGLEIDDELEQLHISLEREAAKQEKQREQRLNLILSFVAFLAIFSAVKDGSDWIVALGWLKKSGLVYNIATLTVLVLFIVIPIYLYYHHKKTSK
nr:hypothetical protein [uncultured Marinifilum sp.]